MSDADGQPALPPYAKSLLRIRVPASVVLASTHMAVQDIIRLGPGTLIQCNKSCEDTLTLQVGGQQIAAGEAVKVNERFGLRVTSLLSPGERFVRVTRGAEAGEKEKGREGEGETGGDSESVASADA